MATYFAQRAEALADAGLERCAKCREYTERTEMEQDLCSDCGSAPATCRRCGEQTTLALLDAESLCAACDADAMLGDIAAGLEAEAR